MRARRNIRGTMGRAGTGVGALLLLGASLIVPQVIGPTGAAAAATAHVVVGPSPTPAFVPPACGTGTPAYNYEGSGDAADPQVVYSGGTYYAFTTGNALGNNIAALVSSSPNSGYGPYTHKLLRIDGPAEPFAVGATQHTDLAGSLSVRRPLGDVLRRGAVGTRVGQRVRLPRRGKGGLHLGHGRAIRRRVQRADRVSTDRIHRPRALRRPQYRHRLSRLEAERWWVIGTGVHLGRATQLERNRIRPRLLAEPSAHERHGVVSLGDHGGGPVDEGGRWRLLPRLLGRRLHEHRLLRGDHRLQRTSRSLRPAEPGAHHVRVSARSGWRCALLRRRGELVARLCGMAWRFARVYQLRVWCRPAALRRPDQPAQWQRTSSLHRAGIGVRVLHGRLGRRHLQLRRSPVLRLGRGAVPEQAGGRDGRNP